MRASVLRGQVSYAADRGMWPFTCPIAAVEDGEDGDDDPAVRLACMDGAAPELEPKREARFDAAPGGRISPGCSIRPGPRSAEMELPEARVSDSRAVLRLQENMFYDRGN